MYYIEKIEDGKVYCQSTPGGTWKFVRVATAEEEYPELNKTAEMLVNDVLSRINVHAFMVTTKCPHPNQCLLEMVIKRLEACV